jgi:mannan endo-1,4-beta-mannosidase
MLDGKVHKSGGVNNFALTGCHHGYAPSQAQIEDYFSKMKAGTMVRTWAFSQSNGTLIDRTVAAAQKYNIKLVLALADGAEYCGSPDFNSGWYSSGFKGAYFSWISTIVPKFKDSPAIGAWEIMNEPALKGGGVSQSVMKSFFDQTAAHIKSKDPNHMVSTGTLAPWMSEFKGASGYADVHNSPHIDIISLHEYDYAYNNSRALISPHFAPTKQAAEQLQKPIIVGEAGITLATGCMTQQERANAYKQKVDAYLTQGASAVFFWGITWPPNEDTVCNEEHGSNDPVNGAVQNMVNNYTPPN